LPSDLEPLIIKAALYAKEWELVSFVFGKRKSGTAALVDSIPPAVIRETEPEGKCEVSLKLRHTWIRLSCSVMLPPAGFW
jgi:hypothetical protein